MIGRGRVLVRIDGLRWEKSRAVEVGLLLIHRKAFEGEVSSHGGRGGRWNECVVAEGRIQGMHLLLVLQNHRTGFFIHTPFFTASLHRGFRRRTACILDKGLLVLFVSPPALTAETTNEDQDEEEKCNDYKSKKGNKPGTNRAV